MNHVTQLLQEILDGDLVVVNNNSRGGENVKKAIPNFIISNMLETVNELLARDSTDSTALIAQFDLLSSKLEGIRSSLSIFGANWTADTKNINGIGICTVSASNEYNSQYAAWKALDGLPNYFHSDSGVQNTVIWSIAMPAGVQKTLTSFSFKDIPDGNGGVLGLELVYKETAAGQWQTAIDISTPPEAITTGRKFYLDEAVTFNQIGLRNKYRRNTTHNDFILQIVGFQAWGF